MYLKHINLSTCILVSHFSLQSMEGGQEYKERCNSGYQAEEQPAGPAQTRYSSNVFLKKKKSSFL